MKANDLAGLEKQNQFLHEEVALVKQSNEQISEELGQLRRKYDDLFEGRDLMELLASLARKQKSMAGALKEIISKRFDVVLPR